MFEFIRRKYVEKWYNKGYAEGYNKGFDEGNKRGYSVGYREGKEKLAEEIAIACKPKKDTRFKKGCKPWNKGKKLKKKGK